MKAVPKPKKGAQKTKRQRISDLKKKVQEAFNRYIVLRDGKCFTCGSDRNLQASHYFAVKSAPATRYDENNVHAQCSRCHIETHNKGGYRYAMAMLTRYGEELMDKLLAKSCSKAKFTEQGLIELLCYYKGKVSYLESKKDATQ